MAERLRSMLTVLETRDQRVVLTLIHWHDMTLAEVGTHIQLSTSRVAQIRDEAYALLRGEKNFIVEPQND